MENTENSVREILSEELKSLRQRIIANHEEAEQVASGKTRKSLRVEVGDNYGILFGRYPFGTLETGRKPGKVPKNFADIIRQWIIDKGITVSPIPYVRKKSEKWEPKYTPQERGVMNFAGAIAHRIAKDGTKLHRDGGRKDIYTPEIEKTVKAITERIGLSMSMEIESINRKEDEKE